MAFWEMQRPRDLEFGEQMGEWLVMRSDKVGCGAYVAPCSHLQGVSRVLD